jgi:3-dehydroquinate synthase
MTNTDGQLLVRVDLGDRSYEIAIGSGLSNELNERLGPWLAHHGHRVGDRPKALVVTDQNVRSPHAESVVSQLDDDDWQVRLVALPAGETTKSLRVAEDVFDHLVDLPADRSTVVIAVGGGVIGDLAGFAAATYNRGIPFVQVPTTLLAMVDSSVGGKVGINHPRGKNLIGAFHQPVGVLIDTDLLKTLPEREFTAGLAEVVKYGVILDSSFFHYLEQQAAAIVRREPAALRRIVASSCELKAAVVSQDEFERTGLRAVLNYGHTFGHAFEALAGYGELLHGEAVSIGMQYAARLAVKLGRIPQEIADRQERLLAALGLPLRLPEGMNWSADAVIGAMRLDKKTLGGKLRFVLPTRLGHVELVPGIEEAVVREVLCEM